MSNSSIGKQDSSEKSNVNYHQSNICLARQQFKYNATFSVCAVSRPVPPGIWDGPTGIIKLFSSFFAKMQTFIIAT